MEITSPWRQSKEIWWMTSIITLTKTRYLLSINSTVILAADTQVSIKDIMMIISSILEEMRLNVRALSIKRLRWPKNMPDSVKTNTRYINNPMSFVLSIISTSITSSTWIDLTLAMPYFSSMQRMDVLAITLKNNHFHHFQSQFYALSRNNYYKVSTIIFFKYYKEWAFIIILIFFMSYNLIIVYKLLWE